MPICLNFNDGLMFAGVAVAAITFLLILVPVRGG
jgi:hypothetical protein